jgi:SAM-dependent methyltransferase
MSERTPSSCPICDAEGAAAIGAAFDVPVLMNRVYATAEAARSAPTGRVRLLRCADCGFTWNAAFRSELIVYDDEYENDQTVSAVFKLHVEARAREVAAAAEPLSYLEIGCGQGGFMSLVARTAGRRVSLEGFDPAWRGVDGEGPEGARIHKTYFDVKSVSRASNAPNVVVTRHTIEHVPRPVAFLATIREALGPGAEATIFVETPCVDWIFRTDSLQDFFYEHCSIFTERALALALARAGFHEPIVGSVFGGQYLWARARARGAGEIARTATPLGIAEVDMRRDEFVERWRARLARDGSRGRLALWGAGAKGVNFALLMAGGSAALDHIVDVNPAKQDRFLGGSGLEVLSPARSAERAISTYYVMNPNYLDEIAAALAALSVRAELVTIGGREAQ